LLTGAELFGASHNSAAHLPELKGDDGDHKPVLVDNEDFST